MEQKPKSPPALQNILTNIDKITSEVDKKRKARTRPSVEQTTQLNPTKEAKKSESQSGSAKDKQKSKTPSLKAGNEWMKEDQSLKSIHQNWNTLEPEAIRAGLTTTSRDNFEMALDDLTRQIGERNIEGTLFAAITLYRYYADVAQVFSTSIPPEFFRVKYEAMEATSRAGKEEWELAREHAAKIPEHWSHLKVQAAGIDEKLVSRTEFSIQDLEQAVEAEEVHLVQIKGEILMKNLRQMEEKLKRQL